MNKIDVKVNFDNPKRPKFYKKERNAWRKISQAQFESIMGYKL